MKKSIFLSFLVLVMIGCETPTEETIVSKAPIVSEQEVNDSVPSASDTTLSYARSAFAPEIRIKMPKTPYRGTILVLQGWNFPNTSWSDSSDLENMASDLGFALVMPEMGKSIYQKRNYPETRKDWRKYPTRTWLVDTVIQQLQEEFGLFPEGGSNFIMGLSTGGRGAFIIAQENPQLFRAGASLSGDYDQSAFPEDNLYRGFFGTDPERWYDDENPVSFAENWSVPMYIGHGEADNVVSVKHAEILKEVKEANRGGDKGWIFTVEPEAAHNYDFWSSEVAPILTYFQGFQD